MSKAKQDAWKKANFSSSTKVTTAQLNKLRAEKTPAQAIAKYKNDPAMREALNRFYGKSRVGGSSSSLTQSGGPGSKMGPRPSGGPGAKGGADGRVKGSSQSSTATRTYGSRTGGKITVNAAADDKRKADFKKRTGTAVAIGASLIPLGRGAMMAKGAFTNAQRIQAIARQDPKVRKAAFDKAFKETIEQLSKTKPKTTKKPTVKK